MMISHQSNNWNTLNSVELISKIRTSGLITSDGKFNGRLIAKDVSLVAAILRNTAFLLNVSISQRLHAIINKLTSLPMCKQCSVVPVKFVSVPQGYKTFCSSFCAQKDVTVRNKREVTNIIKYGNIDPNKNLDVQKKKIHTCISKYNAATPFHSNEIQRKVRTTINNKYGVNSTSLIPEVLTKQKQTRLDNIGVEFPFQSTEIQNKVSLTHQHQFNAIRFSKGQIDDIVISLLENKAWLHHEHYILKKSLSKIANELHVSDSTVGNYLHSHDLTTQHFFFSSGETEVLNYINSVYTSSIIKNTRIIIHPYELDIYIPEYKLAIEYNGLYWHSEQQGKDRNYHKRKYELCKEKGIQLVTIFDDEWQHRQEQVKNKLKSLLHCNNQKLYARKCNIILVSNKIKKEFFNTNHIQGNGPSSINIGLECDGTLVACMSFIKHVDQHYLNRYATSCHVTGGFSKLLKHFQTNYEWNIIISFADNRWSNGKLYKQTGWNVVNDIPPDYAYIKNNKRVHKFNYRRKHLPNLLEHFDPILSEWENCKANNVLRIWDCGKQKFIIKNSS